MNSKIRRLEKLLAVVNRNLEMVNSEIKGLMPAFNPSPTEQGINYRRALKAEQSKLESLRIEINEKLDTAKMIG